MSAPDAAALIGRTFGEFVVREPLSSGGFGMVFRAEQPALGREAVIKVLHTHHRASETAVQRFLREARLASTLDHPYAAHTYAFGAEPDGVLWIAMELVRGTPLDTLLAAQGPIPLARFVPLLDGICEVVHTAHEQGIVHRDLKPANVMVLARAGRLLPKLLDLGIAKRAHEPDEPREPRATAASPADPSLAQTDAAAAPTDARLTEAGAAMGSPMYMAPEQWMDAGTVDARTDLYALGVLAYEALTGRAPFAGGNRMAIAMAHARQPPPPLGDGFPAALDAVLAKALAKRSEDRYATALELGAAFRAASGVAAEPVAPPRLDDARRGAVLSGAPEPLARAVAALDAARHAHQARDALWQVVRVAVRLCAVTALAAHAHVGAGSSSATDTAETAAALRLLRRRALTDAEWLALARALVRPFRAMRDAHPVPELVALLAPDANAPPGSEPGSAPTSPLDELVALRAAADQAAGPADDDGVRAQVAAALPTIERALTALAFLDAYPLVVAGPHPGDGTREWMGARRGDRPLVHVRGAPLAPGQPALVDVRGVPVLSLWPFAQALPPAPGAPDALFLIEGHGRRGARLVALPDAFEHDDDALWEALGAILDDDAQAAQAAHEERAPFPGLAAFTAGDAARFVGRERETEATINRLRVQPLVAVVGPSGAGKSSFVAAGVVPALPDGWRAISVRPGPAPFASLAARLAEDARDAHGAPDARDPTGEPPLDDAALRADPALLGAALRARARTRGGGGGAIVLVVDQLEELFTLGDDIDLRTRYAAALAGAARAADDPVRVVVTLRDDYLLAAEALPALRSRLGPALELLTTPAEPDLLRILTAPVRAAGYDFDDAALPGEMVAAIAHAPGALALLSFTAARLWDLRDRRFRQLTRKSYAALGGVGGALAQHAEATLTAMHSEEQRLAREAFRHLVTADGTRAVLSRAELDQVLGGGPHAAGVVEKLVAARLLVIADHANDAGASGSGERVEVTHEALLDAWPRLVAWRREDAEGARLRDQLRAAARPWDERGRPSGLLWRGDALAEYRIWRARTPGALTAVEQAFADASAADAARGRRVRTIGVGAAFVVLAAGVIALALLRASAERSRARAEDSRADAEANAQKLHDRLQVQYEAQGRRLIFDGDPLQGLAYLDKARDFGARGRAHDFLVAEAIAATGGLELELAHYDPARTPSFSHDGAHLLTASFDRTARTWDADTGRPRLVLHHDDAVIGAKWSPDDRTILTASLAGGAALWDAATGARLRTFAHDGAVFCAVFSPDGTRVLTVGPDDHAKLWDPATGALVADHHGDGAGQFTCIFSPDGAFAATGDQAGTVFLWDGRTGEARGALHGHTGGVRMLRFSPDGARLASASRDRTARVWDLASRRQLAMVTHGAALNSVAWSPDGRRIATSSNDHTAAVWDAATGDRLLELGGHAAGVNRATFSPDGARLATASDDGTARLWDAATGKPLARWLGHRDQITDLQFDATGRRLVTASEDGRALVWDASPQERVTRLVGHTGVIEAAAFSPDGAHVATAGSDGTARLWDAATGRELYALRGHHGILHWIAWSPDGGAVATAGADGTARTWDARTGAPLATLSGHEGEISQVAWSPDGARLFTAGFDGTIRAWSSATGAPLSSVKGHNGYIVRTIAFAPDGATFVTTGDDNHVRTWDAATGAARGDRADRGMPGSVAFDHRGARAASPESHTLAIWDVATGAPSVSLVGHVGEVTATINPWSSDDALIVSGGLDGTARVWDASTGDLLAIYPHGRQVWSAGFSPDGTRILTSADDGTAEIRELPRFTGTADELARLYRCRVPFEVEGDRAVPRAVDRTMCTRTPSAN